LNPKQTDLFIAATALRKQENKRQL
jgi:hypothetical protein